MQVSLNLRNVPMDELITVVCNPVRGAGWYGPTTGLHSVSIQVQNFTGRVNVQAALAANPGNSDWFNVLPNNAPYLQYPRWGYVVMPPSTGESSIFGFNFSTNAVWVRATIDRSYFLPPTAYKYYIGTFGLVNQILLNY